MCLPAEACLTRSSDRRPPNLGKERVNERSAVLWVGHHMAAMCGNHLRIQNPCQMSLGSRLDEAVVVGQHDSD